MAHKKKNKGKKTAARRVAKRVRRPMTQPPLFKAAEHQPLAHAMLVRFTTDEHASIRLAAFNAGKSFSGYVRETVVKHTKDETVNGARKAVRS